MIGRLGGPGTPEIIRAAGGVEKIKGFYWLELVAIDAPEGQGDAHRIPAVSEDRGAGQPHRCSLGGGNADGAEGGRTAGTDSDAEKIAAALRKLSPEDPYLGKGVWPGQSNFGVSQELAFPVGMGLVVDGATPGVTTLDVSGAK